MSLKIAVKSFLLSAVGVFGIDYFSHLFFSNPMETVPYFFAKMALYFVFSMIFLASVRLDKNEFAKILAAGITVSSLWGMYYNVFPLVFDYYPFGISLRGLTFWGMGLWETGIAFGIVHTLAFIGGYYAVRFVFKKFK